MRFPGKAEFHGVHCFTRCLPQGEIQASRILLLSLPGRQAGYGDDTVGTEELFCKLETTERESGRVLHGQLCAVAEKGNRVLTHHSRVDR